MLQYEKKQRKNRINEKCTKAMQTDEWIKLKTSRFHRRCIFIRSCQNQRNSNIFYCIFNLIASSFLSQWTFLSALFAFILFFSFISIFLCFVRIFFSVVFVLLMLFYCSSSVAECCLSLLSTSQRCLLYASMSHFISPSTLWALNAYAYNIRMRV